MSRHIAKLIKAPLVLASAALVIHISAATAADPKGDIQQQMRELLTGTQTTHFVPPAVAGDGKVTTRPVDSQEFVKQLLLGTAIYGGGTQTTRHAEVSGVSAKAEPRKRPVASVDMQVQVQQLLLGQPHARDAS